MKVLVHLTRRGERGKIAATFLGLALVYVGFGWYSYAGTGDLIAFIAGLPLALATAGVVGAWMTAIRLFGGEETETGAAPAEEPLPSVRARVVPA